MIWVLCTMADRELEGKVTIHAGKNRQDSAWVGAATLGLLRNSSSMCVSRDEYLEYGAEPLMRKYL